MAFGYEAHPPSHRKQPAAPTPFHHPPRPIPERSRTAPVSVPNGPAHRSPPPPLPPPTYIDTSKNDLGWHMANREGKGLPGHNSAPLRAGSSLFGGGSHPRPGKPVSIPERNVDIVGHREVSSPSPSSLSSKPRPPPPLPPNSLLTGIKDRDEVVPASPPYLDLRGLMEYK